MPDAHRLPLDNLDGSSARNRTRRCNTDAAPLGLRATSRSTFPHSNRPISFRPTAQFPAHMQQRQS